MRPDIQIQSVIKALTDVVLPALDPANKLAQEQVRLAIGTLALMGKQLPLQFRFDCDELQRLIDFCTALQQQAGSDTAELAAQTEAARAVLDRAQAGPAKVLNAVRSLRAASGDIITKVFRHGDSAAKARVQALTLALSSEQLLRDRAWVISQGWEPDPSAVPKIETLLGIGSDEVTKTGSAA